MKKTLLAAALALGFTGVAQADTSVTLYGIIDTGIGYTQFKDANGNKAKKTGMINGQQFGSRWGLRGTEDLGNGLQAVFQLESGFDSSDGHQSQGGRQFGRHATIGLQSDSWGRIDLGRQTNIASKYFAIASPFGASWGQANIGATFGSANTVRWDNMVMYQTPNFSGFQFGVGYSFNTNGGQYWDIDGLDDRNTKGITTGLRYTNGPIAAALTYDQVKNESNTAAQGEKVSQWNVGLSYDFEVVKVHAGFGQTRDGWIGGLSYGDAGGGTGASFNAFADGFKANLYTFGVSAPVGNGTIMASWAMADIKDFDGQKFDKQNIYSLGYTYALSKRTGFYLVGSYAKDVVGLEDTKATYVGLGINHKF